VDEVGLECLDCHEYYESGEHAGLPTAETCLGCHEGGVTDSPEERRFLEMVANGDDVRFRKLFIMPDHVYYSHRTHVVAANLECAECHGDVASTVIPPSVPAIRITMDTCIDCHEEHDVPTDCTDCHR
jgi:predicted CXXCH cytochrome family protein